MNLRPEEIPDEDVREWYTKKFSLPIFPVPKAEGQPIAISTPSVFSKTNKDIIRSDISVDGYVFFKERTRYFGLSDKIFEEWARNRNLAIKERNDRKIELSCKPLYLDVELNNMCNLRCLFCTCVHGHVKKSSDYNAKLTLEEIDQLSELYKYAEVMETSKAGEPFLTPDLYSHLLRKVRSVNPFVVIHTVTNGTIMTDELLESITKQKLDHMYVSISGHDAENYKTIMHGDFFDRVMQNLKKIQDAKAEAQSKEPYIHFNCQLSIYADPFRILDIADEYGVIEVNFIKTQMGSGNVERFKGRPLQENMSIEAIEELMDRIVRRANELRISINFSGWDTRQREIFGSEEQFYYPHTTKYFDLSLTCPTDAPWFRYCTCMRGVQPCCWSGKFADWTKQPFEEIWNGDYLKDLRRQLAASKYPSVCHCKY